MNIFHLRAVCEVVRQGMKISAAAQTLHKSQPGISRQVRELEDELGVRIFQRRKNKIEMLTPPGREILRVAERVLRDIDSLKSIGDEHSSQHAGDLTIATTHTQARYSLPTVVESFTNRYPNVSLRIRQGTPAHCCELVVNGEADIAIATEPERMFDQLVSLPAYRVTRCVVALKGHPILKTRSMTLQALARYPIITFDNQFSGGRSVDAAFATAGLEPRVMLSAVDADVCKAYVERGLGIAILATAAFDVARDRMLRIRDADHLFKASMLQVSVRRHTYLRGYMLAFISAFAPHLTRDILERAVEGELPDIREMEKHVRPLPARGKTSVPRD